MCRQVIVTSLRASTAKKGILGKQFIHDRVTNTGESDGVCGERTGICKGNLKKIIFVKAASSRENPDSYVENYQS